MEVTINSPIKEYNTIMWAVARSLFSPHSENLLCFNIVGKTVKRARISPPISSFFLSVLPSSTAFSCMSFTNLLSPIPKTTTAHVKSGTKIISTSHEEKKCEWTISSPPGVKSSRPVIKPSTRNTTTGIPRSTGSFFGSFTAFPMNLGFAYSEIA